MILRSKSRRLLGMLELLQNGEIITKKEMAQKFGVNEKTIERDIGVLRHYFDDVINEANTKRIVYDRRIKAYTMINPQ